MYFVHRNAQVKDHQKITAALELMGITSLCPKRIKSHATPRAEVPCLCLNYPLASLLPGTTFDTEDADGRERDVAIREVGDTRYVVPDAHKLKEKAEYEIGIFGAFPIANLEYVKGENGEMDPDVVNSISQTSIKVVFCDD